MNKLSALLIGLTEQHPYVAAFRQHPGFGPVRLGTPDDIGDADVACVCVPVAERAAVTTAAIKAGHHVLVHGVLGTDVAEASTVVDAARSAGTVCMPDYHYRFQPAVRSARGALAAGRIGLPWNVQADYLAADPHARPESLALHCIDTVRALTALPVREVFARSADSALVLMLGHDRGVTSTLVVGRAPGETPDGLVRHRYRLSGSHGLLDVDAQRPAITTVPPRTTQIGADSIAGLLSALHIAVVSGHPAELSLDDALETQRIVEAAHTALATDAPARLERI